MRVLKRHFEKNGSGFVDMVPEFSEDLWNLYNLIAVGDELTGQTIRKVQRENVNGTVITKVKQLKLTLSVTSCEYEISDDIIRASGRNQTKGEDVNLNQYHTHNVRLGDEVRLSKDQWDSVAQEILDQACDLNRTSDFYVILMDTGIANIYAMTGSFSKSVSKIRISTPKRRAYENGRDVASRALFEQVLSAMLRFIDLDSVPCVIVAGPGFVHDDFVKWIFTEAIGKNLSQITSHQNSFISCHASTPFKHSLNEILEDKIVAKRIINTTASTRHLQILEEFYKKLYNDPDRVCYGPKHVQFAVDKKAVQVLMVTVALFKSAVLEERRKYVAMVDAARADGAEVLIFSNMHSSGEQLQGLTGIAATLRFPLPELEDIMETTTTVEHDANRAHGSLSLLAPTPAARPKDSSAHVHGNKH